MPVYQVVQPKSAMPTARGLAAPVCPRVLVGVGLGVMLFGD
ncbi:hypothetical protein [uncultured Mobiluncus sp.]|nr:hypothetical protein [uncultured Mobiluncus sp.]